MKTSLLFALLALLSELSFAADESTSPSVEPHFYVIRRAWHTGIAVAAADWPDRALPLLADFPDARYLEFGWGDAVYYQAEKKTLGMTLAAVLWPTDSVMEVFGLTEVPTVTTADYEAVQVGVSQAQLQALMASIAQSFAGSSPRATGRTDWTVDGLRRFYHARGRFHFFRMCNSWTTQRLKAAGCMIRRWPVITASRALAEARRCQAERVGDSS